MNECLSHWLTNSLNLFIEIFTIYKFWIIYSAHSTEMHWTCHRYHLPTKWKETKNISIDTFTYTDPSQTSTRNSKYYTTLLWYLVFLLELYAKTLSHSHTHIKTIHHTILKCPVFLCQGRYTFDKLIAHLNRNEDKQTNNSHAHIYRTKYYFESLFRVCCFIHGCGSFYAFEYSQCLWSEHKILLRRIYLTIQFLTVSFFCFIWKKCHKRQSKLVN